jgi:hypothetical protein
MFKNIPIIDRAATLAGEFSTGTHAQQSNIIDGLLHCVSATAKHAGVRNFLDPFDSDNRETVTLLHDVAVQASDIFAADKTSNGLLACCGYAAVASMCSLRLRDYAEDPDAVKVAETISKLYGTAVVVRDD